MRILIAEDDAVSRRVLEANLVRWGFGVTAAADGTEALAVLEGPDPPRLAILDWMMPGADGVEVCRRVRKQTTSEPPYIILLTAKTDKDDLVAGLSAGADDYVTKPFDREELRARVNVGVRIVGLQRSLTERVADLQDALSRVKQLQGLLPICSYCKKIRDDQNYWQQVDTYISTHANVEFSHGVCPACYNQFIKPMLEKD